MANYSKKFRADSYTDGYTSYILEPLGMSHSSNQTRGVIQVHIVGTGSVTLQARLHPDAPWFELKIYLTSFMEEIVLANQMRIVVEGEAHCWIGEAR